MPRPGSSRDEQRVRVEGGVPLGHPLLHLHHGAPPLRPVRYDPQLRRKQHLSGLNTIELKILLYLGEKVTFLWLTV